MQSQMLKDRRHHVRFNAAAFVGRALLVSWENTAAIYSETVQVGLMPDKGSTFR